MNAKRCGCTTQTCGCCEGTQALTPATTVNRPGLDALSYRVGTHGAFLATMKARLGAMTVEIGSQTSFAVRPLLPLTTRDAGDPSIALLDGWAVVADVLSFYQERIANEGYLRTATERRSVLELARLVGYKLRPGVASTVYLAYTLDDKQTTPVDIAAGARAQSIPGPDESPQSFETTEALLARAEWSKLVPRRTKPQSITGTNLDKLITVHFVGTDTGLKAGDPLVFDWNAAGSPKVVRYVAAVEADFENKRTTVTLSADSATRMKQIAVERPVVEAGPDSPLTILCRLVAPLSKPAALPAARSGVSLQRDLATSLRSDSDIRAQVLSAFNPVIRSSMYSAWASGARVDAAPLDVYGFGIKASMFGSTAPLMPILGDGGRVVGHEEWPIAGDVVIEMVAEHVKDEIPNVINLIEQPLGALASSQGNWALSITLTHRGIIEERKGSLSNRTELSFTYATVLVTPGDKTTIAFKFDDGSVRFFSVGLSSNREILTVTTAEFSCTVAADGSSDVSDQTGNEMKLDYSSKDKIGIYFEANSRALVSLDGQYDPIQPASKVLIVGTRDAPIFTDVAAVRTISRAAYGITGKSTQLSLGKEWRTDSEVMLGVMRETTVYAQSKVLALADEPVSDDVGGDSIDLDRLYDGLESGRWIIVAGERTDIETGGKAVADVAAAELVMIAGVRQDYDANLPGDRVHSVLVLANKLSYRYKRQTVKIYGNVVKASHGETRNETLGGGDGAKSLQSFSLKQPPLTFIAAETPSGTSSTLEIHVNDVKWHERETLAGFGPKDRVFVTKNGNDDITMVTFGNGEQGARLPTGVENVKAVYRNGIGKSGNVLAEQISLLQTRPLGVKEVINPLRATGGADRESIDLARKNASLAVMALDRLVSVQDYADFARSFAGIGKASASRLSNGQREFVHLTIAGVDDIPIDATSDLHRNLLGALGRFGDPAVPVRVEVRELVALMLSVKVRLAADYLWDPVATRIRTRLLADFGFAKRELAQSVPLGQIIAAIQAVDGVDYVDVDSFGGLPEKDAYADGTRHPLSQKAVQDAIRNAQIGRLDVLSRIKMGAATKIDSQPVAQKEAPRLWPWVEAKPADFENGATRPAQLAIFLPAVPDMLVLNQIK